MDRVVLVLPNGAQLEDLEIGNLKSYVKTQNIIIGHILEIMAKEKALESEIDLLLGELGFDKDNKLKRVKEMLKEEFLFIYGSESEIKEYFTPKEAKIEKKKKSILDYFKKILDYFGIQLTFIRAYGPYEHNVAYRIAKYYFKFSGMIFNQIKSYLASSFQVPGYQIEVRL
jgi:hypothetical protein